MSDTEVEVEAEEEVEEEVPPTVEQREMEPPEGAVLLGPGIWAMPGGASFIAVDAEVEEAEEPEFEPTMGWFDPEGATEVEAESGEAEAPAEAGADLDIGAMTVAEVKEYVEANPDQAVAVYDAEMSGKQRATLLDWLESFSAS